jgi:hypothetical protein
MIDLGQQRQVSLGRLVSRRPFQLEGQYAGRTIVSPCRFTVVFGDASGMSRPTRPTRSFCASHPIPISVMGRVDSVVFDFLVGQDIHLPALRL